MVTVGLLQLAATLAAATLLYTGFNLYQKYAIARQAGFKCLILPTHLMSVSWVIASTIFLPLLDRLPEKVQTQWIPLLLLDRIWEFGHRPFAVTGTDTIMAVSPFQNSLFTCDPELITKLCRSQGVGKPTQMMELLNVFGPSMTGTEGAENKLFRRVAGPFFHTQTLDKVAQESIEATDTLIEVLSARKVPIDDTLRQTLAKMTLHILDKVAFEKKGTVREELEYKEAVPAGHKLSFADTFLGLDQDLPLVSLTPPPVRQYSPLEVHKKAHLLHSEMSKYLEEAVEGKKNQPVTQSSEKRSLLEILVTAGREGVLTPAQVTGNIFIVNLAGHEANGQALFFGLLQLASRPEMLKQVQADIDRIVGHVPADQWNYDDHYQALAESMVGAVLNESLRVYTVLPILPKRTLDEPVTVTLEDGVKHVIPANTLIFIMTSACHRNPRYWPATEKNAKASLNTDPSAFNPYQWLAENHDGKFFTPHSGAYVPFSDGHRGCLGRNFAMVELCFSFARLLQNHSPELAIETSDADSFAVKQQKWQAARDHAQKQLFDGIIYNMTLRLSSKIPIRLVGRENVASYVGVS